MSLLSAYKTILSRKLATSSTNFYEASDRTAAINHALRQFSEEYRPKELRKKAVLTLALDGTPIHSCDAYNSSVYGTFAGSSDAGSVSTDTTEKQEGTGSISFTITPGASGDNFAELTVASLTSLDLSALEDTGKFRMWVYLTTVTDFSSVTLFVGSSSLNYWEITATTDIHGSAFAVGWNRVEFDWADATETGTPVSTGVDYLKVRLSYSASFAGGSSFRIDDIRIVGNGTPIADTEYRVATIPSDLATPNDVIFIENVDTKTRFNFQDTEEYNRRLSGNTWTADYNLTSGTEKLFFVTSSETSLLIEYTKTPTTLVNDDDESGINSKADELIALYAAEKLFSEGQDVNAMNVIATQKPSVVRAWQGKYGRRESRLKSKFERISYHGRING